MHELMLETVVKNCRQRIADGDHPTTKANPTEHLEEAVDQLAKQVTELGALCNLRADTIAMLINERDQRRAAESK